MVPTVQVVESACVVAERLSFITVNTVDHFSSEAKTDAVAAVSRLVQVQALLVEVELVPFVATWVCTSTESNIVELAVTGEGTVRSVLVAELSPATELDSAA